MASSWLRKLVRGGLGETSARPSRINQFLVLVIPQQKSSNALGSVGRLGEAPNHELLPANALDLDP